MSPDSVRNSQPELVTNWRSFFSGYFWGTTSTVALFVLYGWLS